MARVDPNTYTGINLDDMYRSGNEAMTTEPIGFERCFGRIEASVKGLLETMISENAAKPGG